VVKISEIKERTKTWHMDFRQKMLYFVEVWCVTTIIVAWIPIMPKLSLLLLLSSYGPERWTARFRAI